MITLHQSPHLQTRPPLQRVFERLALVTLSLSLLLLSLFFPPAANAQEAIIHVEPGERIEGNVATIQQDIIIDGEVVGDVTSWNGSITVNGRVYGDVISYGGMVTLGSSARVDGHVLALTGNLRKQSTATVAGQVIGEPSIGGQVVAGLVNLVGDPRSRSGTLPGALAGSVLVIVSLALAIASSLVWPRRTEGAGRTLLYRPWRSVALGLITTLILSAVTIMFVALLALTLVGLPFIAVVALLVQIPYLYGLATTAQAIGRRIVRSRQITSEATTVLGASLLSTPLIVCTILTPIWGVVAFYLLAGTGLGALIISRGGAFIPGSSARPIQH